MIRWPSIQQVVAVWLAITAVAYVAYVAYLHNGPRDELVMANDLSFEAVIGLVVVCMPALVLLFLALLLGGIAKRWLVHEEESMSGGN